MATRHPVLTASLVALLVRLVFALVSFALNGSRLIPDEVQYVALADTVARGKSADSWAPFYGQSLYDSTWAFTAPLALLFRLFGTTRLIGQLYAVGWGVATTALTARLAREVVAPAYVLFAGLVVALMPSQVLWSSVVLRESMVWATLAACGLAVALSGRITGPRTIPLLAIMAGSLLVLGVLRSQTLIVGAWALVPAAFVVGKRWLSPRVPAAALIALLVPAASGLGLGGWHLVQLAVPSLAATRTYMSFGANSAFTATTVVTTPPTTTTPSSGHPAPTTTAPPTCPTGQHPTSGGGLGIAGRPQCSIDNHNVVPSGDGKTYVADESVSGNLRQLPRGLVATVLRPLPWERTSGLALLLARLENLAWYVLYALALVGFWAGRRRLRVLAYPALVLLGVFLVAALTQGNLGTAFRHRGQVLWALAVPAAVGLEHLVTRRAAARAAPEPEPVPLVAVAP